MRRARLVFFLVLALAAFHGAAAEPAEPQHANSSSTTAPVRHPLVVLKQTVIHGRVFLIKEDDKQSYAAKMKVEVQTLDGKKSLHKTATTEDGGFALPSLNVGRYRLKVGRLMLELEVQEADRAIGQSQLPKTLLIYMPEEMQE